MFRWGAGVWLSAERLPGVHEAPALRKTVSGPEYGPVNLQPDPVSGPKHNCKFVRGEEDLFKTGSLLGVCWCGTEGFQWKHKCVCGWGSWKTLG